MVVFFSEKKRTARQNGGKVCEERKPTRMESYSKKGPRSAGEGPTIKREKSGSRKKHPSCKSADGGGQETKP